MKLDKDNRINGKIKNWFTWALLALLPGVTGWFIVLTQEQIQENRAATYKSISQQQKEEFLEMYQEWSRLSPQEKAENPWGTGPYGGPAIQKQLLLHQEERLLADLPTLLSDSEVPAEIGDFLYGPGWQSQVEEYRKQIEYREILNICSTILMVTGILGLVIALTLWIRTWAVSRSGRQSEEDQIDRKEAESQPEPEKTDTPAAAEQPEEEVHLFTQKRHPSPAPQVSEVPSDDASVEPPEESEATILTAATEPAEGTSSRGSRTSKARPETATAVLDEVLEEEKEESDDPLLSSLMTPEPVAKELTELTEQMSAIREFAAEQQTQVKKLQDGYDWMLIKRFCLRIIRCIDNIDDRMKVLVKENADTSALEDVRDELIFALESSGVEPYEPEMNRDYRGLEKYAEAIKERQKNTDSEKTGKIAEIVRAGYQYLISDDEVKIVRCAQVKLYA